jgi:hypothetical protein
MKLYRVTRTDVESYYEGGEDYDEHITRLVFAISKKEAMEHTLSLGAYWTDSVDNLKIEKIKIKNIKPPFIVASY